jgi:hypothetical protein
MNDIDTVNVIDVISLILGVIVGVCIILSIKLYGAYKRINELRGELEFAMIKLERVDYILRIISNKFNNVDSEK